MQHMTPPTLAHIVQQALHRQAFVNIADSELLCRFIVQRDASAFAEIVDRYAVMVWNTCQRQLSRPDQLDEAFQITFLTLAQKARSIRLPERLPAWLFGVAHRVARRLRMVATGNESIPEAADPVPTPPDQLMAKELLLAVNEEIAQLPEKYRSVVLLCWLEDYSLDEAAQQLGLTKPKLWGYLKRSRVWLCERLTARGFGLPAILGANILSANTVAAGLLTNTIERSLFKPLQSGEMTMIEAILPGNIVAVPKIVGGLVLTTAVLLGATVLLPAGPVNPPKEIPPANVESLDEKKPPITDGFPLPDGAIRRFGNRQMRHPEGALAALVAPNGQFLVTRGSVTTIVWDLKTLAAKWVWKEPLEHWGVDTGIFAFTPDGRSLVVSHTNRDIDPKADVKPNSSNLATVYDLESGKVKFHLRGSVRSYASKVWVTTDGKEFGVAIGYAIHYFDVRNGQRLRTVSSKAHFDWNTFVSPQAKRLVARHNDLFHFVDMTTGNVVHTLPDESGAFSRLSADGTQFAYYTVKDTQLVVHDIENQKERLRFTYPNPPRGSVTPLQFSADNNTLYFTFSGQRGQLFRWDLRTNKQLPELPRHSTWTLTNVAFDPQEETLFTMGFDRSIRRWQMKNGAELPMPEGYQSKVVLDLHRDGKHLWIADHSRQLDLWELATGKKVKSVSTAPTSTGINSLVQSSDGRWLVTGLVGQTTNIIDLSTGKEVRAIPLEPGYSVARHGTSHTGDIRISPDNRTLFTSSKRTGIKAWELATGRELWHSPVANPHPEAKPLFTLDALGTHLFAADNVDDKLGWQQLDARTGKAIRSVPFPTHEPDEAPSFFEGLRVTADGTRLLSAHTDGVLRQWQVATGREIRRWKYPGHSFASIECSPKEDWVAVGTHTGEALLLELGTGLKLHTFSGHHTSISQIAFTPDCCGLLTNADLAPVLWSLIPKDLPTLDAEVLWKDLQSADGAKVYRSHWVFVQHPKSAVSLGEQRVKVEEWSIDRRKFDACITKLDDPVFQVRELATKELVQAGQTIPTRWLATAHAETRSAEVRLRLEKLLADRQTPQPRDWQLQRLAHILQHANTAETRDLLTKWSKFPQGSLPQVVAEKALARPK